MAVRRKRHVFANYEPDSSREKLGVRRRREYSKKKPSMERRQQRYRLPNAKKVIVSQLCLARRRKDGCINAEELRRGKTQKHVDSFRVGETVRFVPPARRKRAILSSGEFLGWADSKHKFAAIDTSCFKKTARLLKNIEVVRATDVFDDV